MNWCLYLHPKILFRMTTYSVRKHYCKSVKYVKDTVPFLELYKSVTGQEISTDNLNVLKRKSPNLDLLTNDRLQSSLLILNKFDITPYEACKNPHVFCMNPITMDNYGEILKECGWVKILPDHIIRYHTMVRKTSLNQLKKKGLMSHHINLQHKLKEYFKMWPPSHNLDKYFDESKTTILNVRMYVLENFLNWRLHVSSEKFEKYCKIYLPLQHKPMSDILEAIHLAQNEIGLEEHNIVSNGFVLYADPINTKLILNNVPTLADMDIRDAIKMEPAILKNNYISILRIRSILDDFRISADAQRRYLKVYCMKPETVQLRLEELKSSREYNMLSTHPRVLSLVIHKNKMMTRLKKIQESDKQCYSLNRLVGSSHVFNSYISNFGNKVFSRDIGILISSSLSKQSDDQTKLDTEMIQIILRKVKKHKFWKHVPLHVIYENIKLLKQQFADETIVDNCQLLLYPMSEIQYYLEILLSLRNSESNQKCTVFLDIIYNNLNLTKLTNQQILSLVLYEIEKKYHFTGDGIWGKQVCKMESCT